MPEQIEKITVPDIGGAENVDVIELLVKPGDVISIDQSLITLEGDKATMEVPSPVAGLVESVALKTGDKVSAGDLILTIKLSPAELPTKEPTNDKNDQSLAKPESLESPLHSLQNEEKTEMVSRAASTAQEDLKDLEKAAAASSADKDNEELSDVHAGPSARRLAREVGIDLQQIKGSGEKGRITKEDVQNYIKQRMSGDLSAGINIAQMPSIDFSKFGEIEVHTLKKIKKLTGSTLHRNWVSIPHVTQFDEADITEMELFRLKQKNKADQHGYKLTPIVFIMKAVIAALKEFPQFNASLDASNEKIILKKYFHIGVAVETPNGLVVPVIRNVDQKSLIDLAKELAHVSKKVRETGLSLADMQGGCFTISSLGGIGGTAFTPIVNAPEVAILGISKAQKKLVHQADDQFLPRLMLPLSLSYDHRVIDGAEGARFIVYLSECLADIRTLLL